MTYQKKLLDPRWQRLRLKIMERENFSCQVCGDSETTLHIHHKKYNKEPWDADASDLMCCCKHCHGLLEFVKDANWDILKVRKSIQKSDGRIVFTCIIRDTEDGVIVIHFIDHSEITNEYYSRIALTEEFFGGVNNMLSQVKNSLS